MSENYNFTESTEEFDPNRKTGLILPSNLIKIHRKETELGRKLTDEELDEFVLTEGELLSELEKAEEDIREGRYYSADEVFEKLRQRIQDAEKTQLENKE